MQLPVLWPDLPGQNFECRGCTKCCRELMVHLTRSDRERLDAQKWPGRIAGPAYVRHRSSFILNHGTDGACIFLTARGRCRIHEEFGLEAKPLACRLYPFTLEQRDSGVGVGLRFDCPTSAANGGVPIASHRNELKRIADALRADAALGTRSLKQAVPVVRGADVSVTVIEPFLSAAAKWIRNRSVPFQSRLIGLARLAESLGKAKFKRLDGTQAGELLVMLGRSIEALRDDATTGKRELDRRASALFRQTVFSHTEYVTFEESRSPWFATFRGRLQQLRRARRMSAGIRMTPKLRFIEGSAPFDQIENTGLEPGVSSGDFEDLLTRYLAARLDGRSVFGPGYYGWSIVDGLHALLIGVACIGWLTRCIAASEGRTGFTVADAQRAVGMVDRSAGRVPELGARSALIRVRYLADERGIEALLHRYGLTNRSE